ncbi:MAG: AAA family ATPase [Rickettsiaceae bacterium]|nr:AAA family ATPase [Rickettsiaceae bacterium]
MKKLNHKDNFYILSGAPGSGKSSIIEKLKQNGFACINEPAREIIHEQRLIDGDGVYDRDKKLFLELMLSRSIYNYIHQHETDNPVIFDRGLPDIIGYAKLFEVNAKSSRNTSKIYKYNNNILFLPSWQEIYITDEERTMSFDDAKIFGDLIKQSYIELEYNIIKVPLVSIDKRVEFIIDMINT